VTSVSAGRPMARRTKTFGITRRRVFGLSLCRRIVFSLRNGDPIRQVIVLEGGLQCRCSGAYDDWKRVRLRPTGYGIRVSSHVSITGTYLPRPSYLAMGDPVAGRRAYLALKCNTCHSVAGEPIGARLPRLPGPGLGKSVALESPQQIADSIAAPGHAISEKTGPWHRSASSNMGNYTNVMTVRQLMDLVAYLRSLN